MYVCSLYSLQATKSIAVFRDDDDDAAAVAALSWFKLHTKRAYKKWHSFIEWLLLLNPISAYNSRHQKRPFHWNHMAICVETRNKTAENLNRTTPAIDLYWWIDSPASESQIEIVKIHFKKKEKCLTRSTTQQHDILWFHLIFNRIDIISFDSRADCCFADL